MLERRPENGISGIIPLVSHDISLMVEPPAVLSIVAEWL